MREELAVLFLDEIEDVWELVADQADDPPKVWYVEENALKDLKAEGWEIEGPYPMSPEFPGMPNVQFLGYCLRRKVQ